ncbi:hypothetical protein [Rhodococcoides kyotonense]|uniref:Uncharacterized protein n=1 Tax=Rhodococcoides kyotonense TaxID=398843 RepID=A0A239L8B2_9NOCA|nr:hypothetical protein [Rhodococcus kyotonensis]SNT26222.1 hypothetical protein SAMN05421642_11286 [Rhodococcus kyotonensis]
MHDIADICEGTLVIHAVGDAECTDPDCVDLEYVRHVLVLECEEITGGCQCAEHIELRRAS